MLSWCLVQMKKSGRMGLGLYGRIVIAGELQFRYLVWMPHLGPLEKAGERHIIDEKKNYLVVKPENVESAIELTHDVLDSEIRKIWKNATV